MSLINKIKISFLFTSDILILYLSLLAALFIRYGLDFYQQFLDRHLLPFTLIFIVWLAIFYIAGLYDLRKLRNNLEFLKTLGFAILVNAILAVVFFYFIPAFGIAPKTNLFIFLLVFGVVEIGWRRLSNKFLASKEALTNVLLIGSGPVAEIARQTIEDNLQLGYKIKEWIKNEKEANNIEKINSLISQEKIDLIVVPRNLKNDKDSTKYLYELLCSGAEVKDLSDFYEIIFRKIPLTDIEENWFLKNITDQHKFYDDFKSAMEMLFSLVLFILLLPLMGIIAVLIKITSRGPIIYEQIRVGKFNKEFILYKFRTMRADAEKDGAQWKKSGITDPRLTAIGRILVTSHLDEITQLINIMKGELSFVGPRPERPEFTKILQKSIPYYNIRHIIKPGVTGWAQINYKYGASVEDAYEKLQYDIYYLKNRSLLLDLTIILKTIKSFFINQK